MEKKQSSHESGCREPQRCLKFPWFLGGSQGFPGGSDSKESACSVGDLVRSLAWEDLPEKGMATPSSILAWEIPWTEQPGGLESLGFAKGQMRLSGLSEWSLLQRAARPVLGTRWKWLLQLASPGIACLVFRTSLEEKV